MTNSISVPKDRSGDWVARALAGLHAVLERDMVRYARHLERQHRLDDPRDAVLTLAARRLLPLGRSVQRALPPVGCASGRRASRAGPSAARERDATLVLGFRELTLADRRLLLGAGDARELRPDDREHLAAAWLRLTKKAQAARREVGAPPADPQFLVSGADPDPHPGWPE